MSHDLQIPITRPIPITEFLQEVTAALGLMFECATPQVVLLERTSDSELRSPTDPIMGDKAGFYVIRLNDIGEGAQIGMYPTWELLAQGETAPIAETWVEVPFGRTELSFVIASAAAHAMAKLNDSTILDSSGAWNPPGQERSPDDFLRVYRETTQFARWLKARGTLSP
jgi:hypothetical protein